MRLISISNNDALGILTELKATGELGMSIKRLQEQVRLGFIAIWNSATFSESASREIVAHSMVPPLIYTISVVYTSPMCNKCNMIVWSGFGS